MRKRPLNWAAPKKQTKLSLAQKLVPLLQVTYLTFDLQLQFLFRGAAMFCFLKPSFLTGGNRATVISNVGEERKPGHTTEATFIL